TCSVGLANNQSRNTATASAGMAHASQLIEDAAGALRRVSSTVRATDAAAARAVSAPAPKVRLAVSPSESRRPVPLSILPKPEGSALAILSFWLANRFAILPALETPCCRAIVPITTGAKALSNEPPAADPSPE